ncbi:MAG: signal peptide peptidase SppA [Candidatus Kapabacteria bacterium]|nr:signal peptide peptidase SppA [Candidatus Kapabacteria bacterium]
MKRILSFLVFFVISAFVLYSQTTQRSFLHYYQLRDISQSAPTAFKFGLYGFDNPAITSYLHDDDYLLLYSRNFNSSIDDYNWGFFSGSPFGGGGLLYTRLGDASVVDYRTSFAFGDRNLAIGLGYGFVGGDKSKFGRSNTIHAGILSRSNPYLSIGISGTFALDKNEYETVYELAFRPIKNYPLTFYGDMALFNNQNLEAAQWSAGVSFEVVDGIRLNGRYFKDKTIALGLDLSFGKFGVASSGLRNQDNDYSKYTFALRFGAEDRTLIKDIFIPDKQFVKLDLSGPIKYQKFAFLDNSLTLLKILNTIELAKNNENVSGLVINATTLAANRAILWEIRDKLEEFRNTGKKVIIFLENADINLYHFASVADKIIIDPLGMISLEGYIMGRSFYKDLFAKAGIGFEEIRLFKYKSAYENFARDKMSDADREQRQKIVDDWFEIASNDIERNRKISAANLKKLMDEKMIYFSSSIMQNNLADATGRWTEADSIVKKIYPEIKNVISSTSLTEVKKPFDDKWSLQKNYVAVVYAIGECAMETGIKARSLVNTLKSALKNPNVKAVVLRVDSPGGDAMASDYISEVMKEYKDKKPIIVSQGGVAGSGGYWLSMYGSTIVATPMTITGSIGVIAGWLYDKGLKDSIGVTTDFVKVGKYADLGFSYSLPLLGLGMPIRNLTEDERKQYEDVIKDGYSEFIKKVADGRKADTNNIEKVAQGRVWSGLEAIKIGLVDSLGNLDKSIKIAAERAGLKKDEYDIMELPKPGFMDFSALLSRLLNFETKKEDKHTRFLKFLTQNNGKIIPLMPFDFFEEIPGD